jgi:hypothetical protein
MGAWGVAVFSDDLAADLRGEFRDLIGEGLSSTQAVEKLLAEYESSLADDDEKSVFWIALAAAQWKMGRLEERTKAEALRAIDSGQDLERWEGSPDRKKRAAVLEKLRGQLLSPQPTARRVPRRIKEANDWSVGEVIGFRLLSGRQTLFRVIGHHTDQGGRFAVCEPLDWVGGDIPSADAIAGITTRKKSHPHGITQFLFQQPRKKGDQARVLRTGIVSTPTQLPGSFAVVVWSYVDKLLDEFFGLK